MKRHEHCIKEIVLLVKLKSFNLSERSNVLIVAVFTNYQHWQILQECTDFKIIINSNK